MPNWASGYVSVIGQKENVINFVNRFIFDDEPTTIEGKRFFARSFTNCSRNGVMQDINDVFDECEDGVMEFNLPIFFAWSAYSCLIDGYPQKYPDECITLAEACKEDGVYVEIKTEEYGLCFEEYITCDREGNLTKECRNMPVYVCRSCGNKQSIATYTELEDEDCYECNESNWGQLPTT